MFPEIVIPSTFKVPGVKLKIPPPEPKVPVAVLLVTEEVPSTTSVPPLLKIPPPPLSAAAPCASFPSTITFVTVIVPTLFQRPPPSEAATLSPTVPFVKVAFAEPVIWIPPPFPGAAVAGATPALF